MDPPPTTASVLGDAVAAALNNNLLSVELSPFCSRLEAALVETFAERFGLGPDAGGVLASGGSLSNLQALAVARSHVLGTGTDGWVGAGDGRPVLFASDVAHTSLETAATVLGLGTDAVVAVETDDGDRLRPDALAAAIGRARARGERPFCVVATAGTTTTGAIDPLAEAGAVAAREGLWYHVDAAYGGAIVLSERHRDDLDGIGRADSVTFNPQKWLYVAKTCSMALFADAAVLDDEFRVGVPYTEAGGRAVDRGEIGIQGSRHADVLKLWLSLQHLGERGYAALLDESYRLTAHLAAGVRARPWLELATEPETNLLAFRADPGADGVDDPDATTLALGEHLLERELFLSRPTYRGGRWLRAVLLNPYTDVATLDGLLAAVDEFRAGQSPATG
jgi:glutamate/tyrosine decarboxylase-like PLP-dependent enzyme